MSIRSGSRYSWFFFTSTSRSPWEAYSLAMAFTALDLPVPASPYKSTLLAGSPASRALGVGDDLLPFPLVAGQVLQALGVGVAHRRPACPRRQHKDMVAGKHPIAPPAHLARRSVYAAARAGGMGLPPGQEGQLLPPAVLQAGGLQQAVQAQSGQPAQKVQLPSRAFFSRGPGRHGPPAGRRYSHTPARRPGCTRSGRRCPCAKQQRFHLPCRLADRLQAGPLGQRFGQTAVGRHTGSSSRLRNTASPARRAQICCIFMERSPSFPVDSTGEPAAHTILV